ncbi:site-specific integrase [Luteibacter sp. 9135]|uniref:site-specific integrase n=1 Tax=Luteibacter sp. 9135 TaxID=1500893 RepID=UPI0009E01E4B|nr:site-specific integrase [Luteibacter sp. 9135]
MRLPLPGQGLPLDVFPPAPPASHFSISRTLEGWHISVGSKHAFTDALEAARQMLDLPMPERQAAMPLAGLAASTAPVAGTLSSPDHRDAPGVMLSEVMREFFLDYMPTTSWMKEKGKMECRASLELFLLVTGDRPLSTLVRDHFKRFVKILQLWPVHASKKPDFKDIVDPAVMLKKADELSAPRLSPVTVGNRVHYVQFFTRWLQDANKIHFDPWKGVLLPSPVQQLKRRPPTPQELAIIFDAENRKSLTAPHDWWSPILALYTGARLREVAQLYLDDIDVINDVPCIHINARFAHQQLKTDSSRRVVPLHPELERLGFLDYVKELRANGEAKLFPGLPWLGGDKVKDPGRRVGRYFSETYLPACGITDPAVTFHSFRHNFATQANRANLDDDRIARITGHKLERQNALSINYIQAKSLPERMADLISIELPTLNLAPYQEGQFSGWFAAARRKRPARKSNLPEPRASVLKPSPIQRDAVDQTGPEVGSTPP